MFIEGLVPIASLQDERYFFRDTDRTIVGATNGRMFKLGLKVRVLLDRIDRQQRRLQFALLPSVDEERIVAKGMGSLRSGKKKIPVGEDGRVAHVSPDRSGKPRKSKGAKTKSKARLRDKKSKGKRR